MLDVNQLPLVLNPSSRHNCFGIGVDEIAGDGLGCSLFQTGVYVFEVLVVAWMDNAKTREFFGGV